MRLDRGEGDRLRSAGWALWAELDPSELAHVRWPRTVPVCLTGVEGLPPYARPLCLWVPRWGFAARVEAARLLKEYANPLPRPHTAAFELTGALLDRYGRDGLQFLSREGALEETLRQLLLGGAGPWGYR